MTAVRILRKLLASNALATAAAAAMTERLARCAISWASLYARFATTASCANSVSACSPATPSAAARKSERRRSSTSVAREIAGRARSIALTATAEPATVLCSSTHRLKVSCLSEATIATRGGRERQADLTPPTHDYSVQAPRLVNISDRKGVSRASLRPPHTTPTPNPRITAQYPGNVFATHPGSRMVTPATFSPANAKLMAMR